MVALKALILHLCWGDRRDMAKAERDPAMDELKEFYEKERCHISKKALNKKGGLMLYWAAVFFVIALVAGVFGFAGIAAATAGIAKILFFIFLIFFVVSLITGMMRRGPRL